MPSPQDPSQDTHCPSDEVVMRCIIIHTVSPNQNIIRLVITWALVGHRVRLPHGRHCRRGPSQGHALAKGHRLHL
jgi:hypothetical protein